MEEWKEYKLEEIGEIVGGSTPSTNNPFNYDGEIAWITPKDLSNFNGRYISKGERMITSIGFKNSSCRMLPKGSVLFSSRAPIGYIAIASNDLCTNQGFKSIIPNGKIVDSVFLYYLLVYNKKRIENLGSGTTFKEVSGKTMKSVCVKIPSLQQQTNIANFLSCIDDKIENNRKINENLEQQAQALFKSWFFDFEPFRDQPFVDSELGMIPQGWKVGCFLDIVDIMPGGTPSTSVEEYWKNGIIPFFSPKDVNGVYCFQTEKYITQKGLDNCSSNLYPKDTLFITARGTVGKIALSGVAMAMNQSNYALVTKNNEGKFYLFLLTKRIIRLLLKKANGAVFSAITTKDFKEPVIDPPYFIKNEFETVVSPLFDRIHTNMLENIKLSKLRDALLPKLMSGEIKV